MNLESGALTQVTRGSSHDLCPSWAPDNSRIAFVSDQSGSFDLYMIAVDGSDLTQLSDTPEDETTPSWSPDGLMLVYVQVTTLESGLQEKGLHLWSADTGVTQIVNTGGGSDLDPDWSPDGRYLAFAHQEWILEEGIHRERNDVRILDMATGLVNVIPTQVDAEVSYPKWLPREGYYLSVEYATQESLSWSILIFKVSWRDGQPELTQVPLIVEDPYGRYAWGGDGEWLIAPVDMNVQGASWEEGFSSRELIYFSLPSDLATYEALPYTAVLSMRENTDLITDNCHYDDYPDWTP